MLSESMNILVISGGVINKLISKLLPLIKSVDREVWLVGIFFLLHLVIGQLKIYLIAIALLLFALYKANQNFLASLWLTFLATLPFGRGRFYEYVVIPKSVWSGNWDLSIQVTILFSDILLALIVYVLLSRYRETRRTFPSRHYYASLYLSLLVFVAASAVSMFFAQFPLTSLYFFIQLSKLVLIFLVASMMFSKKKYLEMTLKVLVLFVLMNALLVVGQYINRGPLGLEVEEAKVIYLYADENPGIYRPGGFSIDPNIAATLFATFTPILLLNTITTRKRWAVAGWLAIGLVGVALVFTGSRSAWLVTGLASLLIILYIEKTAKLPILIPKFFQKYWILILVFLLLIFGLNLKDRLFTLTDIFGRAGGGTYRIEHIKIGWYFLTSRLYGVGVGLFPFAMASDFPVGETGLIPNIAHNIFAQLGAETGFVGLFSFLVFLGLIIKLNYQALVRKLNVFDLSVFVAFISFLLLAGVFPWFLHPRIDWLFWILAAYGCRV